VGSLAVGVGWLSACAAYLARNTGGGHPRESTSMAGIGAVVAVAIVLMKVVPGVPGSFTRAEWIAFAIWSAAGLVFWLLRPPPS
jgi:basic amino acid/polyamine antiporter, APA family